MTDSLSNSVTDISTWEWVRLQDKDKLPDKPGIYACTVSGTVMYIGQSATSIKQRWANHEKYGLFVATHDPLISYLEISGPRSEILAAESELIRQFCPPFNKSGVFTRTSLAGELRRRQLARKHPQKDQQRNDRVSSVNDTKRLASASGSVAESMRLSTYRKLHTQLHQIEKAALVLAQDTARSVCEIDRVIDERIKHLEEGSNYRLGAVHVDPKPVKDLINAAVLLSGTAWALYVNEKVITERNDNKVIEAVQKVNKILAAKELESLLSRFNSDLSDAELEEIAEISALFTESECEQFEIEVASIRARYDQRTIALLDKFRDFLTGPFLQQLESTASTTSK